MTAKQKTWGDVFNHHVRKGCDRSDAAYRADQWHDRAYGRTPPRTEDYLAAVAGLKAVLNMAEDYFLDPSATNATCLCAVISDGKKLVERLERK